MSDRRSGRACVTVELNGTLAELLAKLCVELETDDPGVLSRALGLLELVHARSARAAARVRTSRSDRRRGVLERSNASTSTTRRFRQIVRGQDHARTCGKYISQGELIGDARARTWSSIPIPQIDIPRFRFGDKQQGGVGQGEGDAGRPARPRRRASSRARARPASDAGEHVLEVDVTLDELAEILGEELELPDIEPKGKSRIVERQGPLHRHPPRRARSRCATSSARSARRCKRQIAIGTYDPKRPIDRPGPRRQALPLVEDRDRAGRQRRHHLHDGRLRLDGRRAEGDRPHRVFWIDTWLRRQYKGLETRYIIHDAIAREVDRDTFFRTRESGGTMISLAYKLCAQDDRGRLPARRVEHLPVPLLRRRQLVRRRHARRASSCSRRSSCRRRTCSATARSRARTARASSSRICASTSTSDDRVGHERDPRQGRDRGLASRTSWARGSKRCRKFALNTALPAATCATSRSAIEEIAQGLRPRLLPDRLRDPRLRPDERGRRVRRLSRAATRTGASAWSTSSSARATSTASRRSTRWSSTTTLPYAYLLEGNSLVDQKLVMAHVYGARRLLQEQLRVPRRPTRASTRSTGEPIRKWIDRMANHGAVVRRWANRVGIDKVEDFIDPCLSLENLIDPSRPFIARQARAEARPRKTDATTKPTEVAAPPRQRDYMETFINPAEYLEEQTQEDRGRTRARPKKVPGGARARRAGVPARARAARALGARRPRDHPRRGLLLRAADADQDHERGLGHLLALARS